MSGGRGNVKFCEVAFAKCLGHRLPSDEGWEYISLCTLDVLRSESSSESGEDQEGEGAESNASSSKSSSDEEMQEQPNAEPEGDVLKGTGSSQTMEELFGGEADLSSSDDEIAPTRRVHEEVDFANLGDEDDDEVGVAGDNVEEGEGQEEVEEEAPRINVDIPRCVAHLGSDLYFVKLPNFLSVETR